MAVVSEHDHADISYLLGILTGKVSSIEKLLYALVGIGGGILIALIGGIVALIWRLGG